MGKMSQLHAESARDRANDSENEANWAFAEVTRLEAEVAELRDRLATLAEGDPARLLRDSAEWIDAGLCSPPPQELRVIANAIDKATAGLA